MTQIWTPQGGLSTFAEKRAAKAVVDYDPDLVLGQQPDGEWVVFLTRSAFTRAGHSPHPVFSLGYELPHPEAVTRKLAQHDVRRNGAKIVAEVDKRNEAAKQRSKIVADEGAGIAAERFEFEYRRVGGANANPRVFIP
jgi:hypothetical protein